jgi:serine/threonine protein kinase
VAGHESSLIGRHLGAYRLEALLGRGGMGEVYRARDTRLGREVAIKILAPDPIDDPERKLRFLHEARAASVLNHPNIVTLHDIVNDGGVDFLVLECVRGKSLHDLIPPKGMPLADVLAYGTEIAEALAAAHAAGILHRDIKPANVMVTLDGHVKVLDFGLAKSVSENDSGRTGGLTQAGTIWGTVPYMSPEQAMGVQLDQRSDIFSFGSVLYESITGQQPFFGSNPMAILHAVTFEHPVPISRLQPDAAGELERVVNKALQKKAIERYQTLKEALVDLKRLRKDLSA